MQRSMIDRMKGAAMLDVAVVETGCSDEPRALVCMVALRMTFALFTGV